MAGKWKENLGAILFLLAVAAVSISPVLFPEISRSLAQIIEQNIASFGIWGPIVMVLLLIVATVVSPIPNSLIIIAMGATYGLVWGTLLALAGAILAASTAFFLARTFGEKLVERFFPKTHFVHAFLSKNAFPAIFVLRIIPSVSFDMISYGVGLTQIPFRTFIAASAFGMIPGVVSFIFIGAGLTGENSISWIGVGLYAALIIVGFFLGSRMGIFNGGKK